MLIEVCWDPGPGRLLALHDQAAPLKALGLLFLWDFDRHQFLAMQFCSTRIWIEIMMGFGLYHIKALVLVREEVVHLWFNTHFCVICPCGDYFFVCVCVCVCVCVRERSGYKKPEKVSHL